MRIRKYMYAVIYVMMIFLFTRMLTISAFATSSGTESGSELINTNGGEVTKELVIVNDQVNSESIAIIDVAEGEDTQYVNLALNNATNADSTIYVSQDDHVRTIQWSMNAPVTLKGYAFHTANYAPDRLSPKAWNLYGSNDVNGEWILLDEEEDGKLEEVGANALSPTFSIDTPGEYQYYKIELIDMIGDSTQYKFRELFLYAEKSESEEENAKPKYTETIVNTTDNELRILISSDTHYTYLDKYQGVDEDYRIQLWVDSIKKEHAENPFDLILLLGDYSLDHWKWGTGGSVIKDGISTTKTFIDDYVSQLPDVPMFILPGNHEQQGEETWFEMTGNYRNGIVLLGDTLFILPDTYGSDLDPKVHSDGTYTPIDTEWLKEMMEKYPNTDVYILAHYIDQTKESDEFKTLVADNDRIKGMFMGHTHTSEFITLNEVWGNKTIAQTGNFSYYSGSSSLRANFWGFRELVITSDNAYSQYIIAESNSDMVGADGIFEHIDRETTSPVVYYGEMPRIYDSLSEYVNVYDKINPTSITGDLGVSEEEGLSAVFDGNIFTKYCVETVIGEDGTRTIQWAMKEPLVLDAYAFFTGNDMYQRDPWAWTLYASNDPGEDKEWTELSEVIDANEEDVPEERNKVTSPFIIENAGEYQYYKFVIANNRKHRSETKYRHYQLSELVLLQEKERSGQ